MSILVRKKLISNDLYGSLRHLLRLARKSNELVPVLCDVAFDSSLSRCGCRRLPAPSLAAPLSHLSAPSQFSRSAQIFNFAEPLANRAFNKITLFGLILNKISWD
ncbi:MAG TPA: hypothetical protein V6C69_11060 [Trichormus sp.]|jgi:hypothetical protein